MTKSDSEPPARAVSRFEFVALMAAMTALDALAIDSMLPALDHISSDLAFGHPNDRQFVVTTIFLGFGVGLLFYGAAADSIGRRRPAIAGMLIYLVGTMLCALASDLSELLTGRILQGFGAAGPYVLSLAIIRDTYSGREMASVMSLVMMIFMAVPALAPLLGQAILFAGDWRLVFLMLAAYAVIVLAWFYFRQPETLKPAYQRALRVDALIGAARTVLSHRVACALTVSQGLIVGAFVAYLSTTQPIFQQHYGVGAMFPVYFASMAVALAAAAWANSRWVVRYGAESLVRLAYWVVIVASALGLMSFLVWSEVMPFAVFILYMLVIYACCGLLFGNLSSLAMNPMGEVAGVASSMIASVSTLVSFSIGSVVGRFYQSSPAPVVAGFFACGVLGLLLVVWARRRLQQ